MLDTLSRGEPSSSPLIFLHGLFGDHEDWLPVISHLEDQYHCIAINLPVCKEEILSHFPSSSTLIGYSMGGRLALSLAPFFKQVILISAHLNQMSSEERERRKEWETVWKEKLLRLPAEPFFTEWYNQPLFSSLSPSLKKELIEKRAQKDPSSFLSLFSTMSLLKQPPFSSLPSNVSLIYGEKDSQYEKMYRSISLNALCIRKAGHVCHLENPIECAHAIQLCLEKTHAQL